MSRLRVAFAQPGKKLVVYVTCGDPSMQATVDIAREAVLAGADVIELGMPFSDPSADGPAIQHAMHRALSRGATVAGTLGVVRALRAEGVTAPVVLFGYYNPVFVWGAERFCREAAAAGADGLLLVDLPVDEAGEILGAVRAAGLELVPLVAPTSPRARMDMAAALAPPFVYYVSMTGVTGAALSGLAELPARVAEVREAVRAPVAVGFGIATPADARAAAAAADAIVVGSAIVRAIEGAPGNEARAAAALTRALKQAI